MHDPIDPFWTPTPPAPRPDLLLPVRWHVRDGVYWVTEGDVLHPVATMPVPRAQRLLLLLTDQAESDLLAAFRDLPLLAALRHRLHTVDQSDET